MTNDATPGNVPLSDQLGPPRDCVHGQLARSCDRCADAAEIAELRAEVAALRAEVNELRRACAAISDCSDDPGAVECANEAMKKLRAEWRKPGGLMDGPFI